MKKTKPIRINHLVTRVLSVGIVFMVFVSCGWFFSGEKNTAPRAADKVGPIWTELSEKDKSSKADKVEIDNLNRMFVDLNKRLSGAVVNVYTKTRIGPRIQGDRRGPRGGGPLNPDDLFQYFFGNPFGGDFMPQQPREAQSLGSGFVISADGLVVTNSHVVRSNGKIADSIMVKFLEDAENSKGHEATVLGVDETTDVAVLKLKTKKNLKSIAPLGNSDSTEVGEWVVAIGNPYGHQNSFTKGVVSALGRDLEQSRADFIQTDASINPGNSGGPLINLYGEVIGINTAIDARAQGIGFAIPINIAKGVIRQIVEKGEVILGWIGVGMSDLTPEIANSLGLKEDATGVLVREVFPGEPADKSGLKSYDVILEVAGKKINRTRDLMLAISGAGVGSQIPLTVFRDGKTRNFSVTVGKRKSPQELARQGRGGPGGRGREDEVPESDGRGARLKDAGLGLIDLSPEIRRRLDLEGEVAGAVISEVYPDSPAARAGLNPGDVITEIDRKTVKSVAEARNLLKKSKANFLLKVQRSSASMIVVLDMKANPEEE
jgi:serine protease Do